MGVVRKRFSETLKAKVALEAVKGQKTTAEISSEFGVHASQIRQWKKELTEKLPGLFGKNRKAEKENEALIAELYRQIGELQVETQWLKKKLHV